VTADVTTSPTWDDLDATQRARAEALVRQEQPELTRLTQAQGAIWRQAVMAVAARLPTDEQIGAAATEVATPPRSGAAVPAQEKTS
jgi:hypothetical protein